MTAIYLTENDVAGLLDMPAAINAVTDVFRHWADGQAENQPRRRVAATGIMLHTMSAADSVLGLVGCKVYTTTKHGAKFYFQLFNTSGELLAIIAADRLGQMRTGAVSGVATQFMARADAATIGCFGTGWQARAQLLAICAVRTIRLIQVYGRDAQRRRQFAEEMSGLCGVTIEPVETPAQAASGKEIVVTATTSKTPIFDGHLLSLGTHLCVIGSNFLTKTEIDPVTVRRADRIVCDSVEACRLEAGDFVAAHNEGHFSWSQAKELADIVVGKETGRDNPAEITLFKSVGLALEDLAVAAVVYRKALEQRLGQPLSL